MRSFLYRNHTVEPLFANIKDISYSEYGSVYSPEGEDYSMLIWCYFLTPTPDQKETLTEIEDIKVKLNLVANSIKQESLLIFTLDGQYLPSWQLSSNSVSDSISKFNADLYNLSKGSEKIKVINISDFLQRFKADQIVDLKYYYLSKIIVSPLISPAFQVWFSTMLNAINGQRKKCLVLDLDNTLWGGVLGEDGLNGIKVGNTYPGNCFLDFQKQLLEAKKNGILLTVLSKNNEDEVWQAFDTHPDFILKKGDFVAYRINWNNKAANIREIAKELNIGTDSLVFLDDNPAERTLVNQLVPEVLVPDFPDQPYKLTAFFQDIYQKYFLTYKLTAEDVAKTDQYKANTERAENSKGFGSIEEYLLSLQTVITISQVDAFNIPRIAQLTQKTNQFNLTTKRYTEPEISKLNEEKNLVFCASVSDRFGDNGITAVGIILLKDDVAKIDNYLLSCRILGREIEFALLKTVLNHLFLQDILTIESQYIPTLKNKQTENFYDKLGFTAKVHLEGRKEYRLSMKECYAIDNLFTIDLKINK